MVIIFSVANFYKKIDENWFNDKFADFINNRINVCFIFVHVIANSNNTCVTFSFYTSMKKDWNNRVEAMWAKMWVRFLRYFENF